MRDIFCNSIRKKNRKVSLTKRKLRKNFPSLARQKKKILRHQIIYYYAFHIHKLLRINFLPIHTGNKMAALKMAAVAMLIHFVIFLAVFFN